MSDSCSAKILGEGTSPFARVDEEPHHDLLRLWSPNMNQVFRRHFPPFTSNEEVMTLVESWLGRTGSRVCGGLMSIAWLEPRGDQPLVTGRVLFHEEQALPRPIVKYPSVCLEDRWLDRSGLLALVADLLGEAPSGWLPCRFRRPSAEQVYTTDHLSSTSGWAEMSLTWDVESGRRDPEWLPAVAPGALPFRTWAEAAGDWVFGQHATYSNDLPHQGRLVFVMPDRRGRVDRCEARQNKLLLHSEINPAATNVELQFAYSRGRHRLERGSSELRSDGTSEIPLVSEASTLDVFLLDEQDGLISHRYFSGPSLPTSERDPKLQAAEDDLDGGETDRVEFKPFVRLGDPKSQEVIRSIIALANTLGGWLYVGVDDEGRPQGDARLFEAFKKAPTEAIALADKEIRKLVRDRINPVPSIEVEPIVLRGAHFLRIHVPPGEAVYSTHSGNDVWIRRGATNRRPSPTEYSKLVAERARTEGNSNFDAEDLF
jgi:hypothetical protein